MKKFLQVFLFSMLAVFLMAGSSMASPFGTNITIYDNRSGVYTYNNGSTSDGGGWWTNMGEDQEVEPGMVHTQAWDLEGFFFDGTSYLLTMVGGFDFKNGVSDGGHTYTSGDIFIDVDGDASYGTGADPANNFGYDYVMDLDFSAGTYNVYTLGSGSGLLGVYSYNDPESNPWKYVPSSDDPSKDLVINGMGMTLYGYPNTDSVPDLGFEGSSRYAVSVNMAWLVPFTNGSDFTAHFTMECGNDNLMGHTPVPEPATMLLFGTGLIGLAGMGRRKFLSG